MSWKKRLKQRYFSTLAKRLGYSDTDTLVIVNIDDVGLHKDVTEASFKALKFGIGKNRQYYGSCPKF